MPTQDAQYIRLPDGSYGKFRRDASDADIRAIIQRGFPQAFAKPKPPDSYWSGVGSELMGIGKGAAGLFAPPKGAGETIAALLGPPGLPAYRAIRGDLAGRGEATKQADEQFKRGEYLRGGVTTALAGLPVPGTGAIAAGINRSADEGNLKEMAGRGTVDILSLLAGKKGSDVAKAPAESFIDPISPLERSVRSKIAPAIKPVNPGAYQEVVKILREPDIMPTIAEYADRTMNPLKDHLQLARATQEAGKEVTGYYQENIIDPNADEVVSTFKDAQGKTHSLTVRSAYTRLGEINKLLEPTYLKVSPGQELTAMDKIGLTRERDALNGQLYDVLSERTGLPPEQIQRINQRGASLQKLGKQIEASQNAREQRVAGFDEQGNPIPHGIITAPLDLSIRLINKLRGGTLGGATRRIQGAIKKFPQGYDALPDPEQLAQYRRMVERQDLGRVGQVIGEREAASAPRRAATANLREQAKQTTPTPSDERAPVRVEDPGPERDRFIDRRVSQRQGLVDQARKSRAEALVDKLAEDAKTQRERELLARARKLQQQATRQLRNKESE